jgi:hypothetical protein
MSKSYELPCYSKRSHYYITPQAFNATPFFRFFRNFIPPPSTSFFNQHNKIYQLKKLPPLKRLPFDCRRLPLPLRALSCRPLKAHPTTKDVHPPLPTALKATAPTQGVPLPLRARLIHCIRLLHPPHLTLLRARVY